VAANQVIRWQLTLCDLIWQVMFRSSEMDFPQRTTHNYYCSYNTQFEFSTSSVSSRLLRVHATTILVRWK